MRRHFISFASGLFLFGFVAASARADDTVLVPTPATPAVAYPANGVVGTPVAASSAWEPWAFAPGEGNYGAPPPRPGFVKRLWHGLPCYCWADVNSAGCSNLKAECAFVFGSCRQFYGQPCYKGPAPVPGIPNGGAYAPAGCSCP
jgi:hypothetical protein